MKELLGREQREADSAEPVEGVIQSLRCLPNE